MKRSEINQMIIESLEFLESMNFSLPPWSCWSPENWREQREHCDEIFDNQLGWDLTDFGLGDFSRKGLILFTIRNGNPKKGGKTYAEKVMLVDENQITPLHFHWTKMEDIINRGGGNLMMQLYASTEEEKLARHKFEVSLDGVKRTCDPGEVVVLHPGESITLYQGQYHSFYGEPGTGKVLVGEVSSVNDDHADNRFYDKVGRFPDIEEDEPISYLLTSDYKNLK